MISSYGVEVLAVVPILVFGEVQRARATVGSQAKADYIVRELGFHAAINYRTDDLMQALGRVCPRGIDVYFENVGGACMQ